MPAATEGMMLTPLPQSTLGIVGRRCTSRTGLSMVSSPRLSLSVKIWRHLVRVPSVEIILDSSSALRDLKCFTASMSSAFSSTVLGNYLGCAS